MEAKPSWFSRILLVEPVSGVIYAVFTQNEWVDMCVIKFVFVKWIFSGHHIKHEHIIGEKKNKID